MIIPTREFTAKAQEAHAMGQHMRAQQISELSHEEWENLMILTFVPESGWISREEALGLAIKRCTEQGLQMEQAAQAALEE